MKNALVNPGEIVFNVNTKEIIGIRIAEVSENEFEIAKPLFWMTCDDNVIADQYYFDKQNQVIQPTPVKVTPPAEPKINTA